MIKKCIRCGSIVDTDNDECLVTSEGVLCATCANDPSDLGEACQSQEDDCPQTFFQGEDSCQSF